MPTFLNLPYLSFGIAAILAGAVVSLPRFQGKSPRRNALACLLVAALAFGIALWHVSQNPKTVLLDPWIPWLEADSLDSLPLVMYALVAAVAICMAPRRDVKGFSLTGILILVLGTEITYAAANLTVLNVGWWITCVPFVWNFFDGGKERNLTRIALISSAGMLTVGSFLFGSTDVHTMTSISQVSLIFLVMAVVIRKGLFPFHGWTLRAFESGPLLPTALLFNSHLGALLVARSESAALPASAYQIMEVICILALATALVTSLRGFAEKKPRRMLAFVCISQASFILAGLSALNAAGVMGGMLHWIVVTFASTGLIGILRILEVRVLDVADPNQSLGLAVRAPRLATFFLICGLALVGLPGTLGYCAEDLLFHGAQERHPILGISLILATAFNAINLFRLYITLFLGVLPKNVIEISDAMPRERWPLALLVIALIFGGLVPSIPVAMRQSAMELFPLVIPHQQNKHKAEH